MVCAVRKKGRLLPSRRFINAFQSHKNINSAYLSWSSFVLIYDCVYTSLFICTFVYTSQHACVRV